MLLAAILLALGTPGAGTHSSPITTEKWSEGEFSVEINILEQETVWGPLLELAQAMPPPKKLVAKLPEPGSGCDGLGLEKLPRESRWWSYCDSGMPVPLTVNNDVVSYFHTAIRDLAKKPERDPSRLTYAHFQYLPVVTPASEFVAGSTSYKEVTVVRLSLHLSFGGGGCDSQISMERVLIYKNKSELLTVIGDGVIHPKTECY